MNCIPTELLNNQTIHTWYSSHDKISKAKRLNVDIYVNNQCIWFHCVSCSRHFMFRLTWIEILYETLHQTCKLWTNTIWSTFNRIKNIKLLFENWLNLPFFLNHKKEWNVGIWDILLSNDMPSEYNLLRALLCPLLCYEGITILMLNLTTLHTLFLTQECWKIWSDSINNQYTHLYYLHPKVI